MNALLHLANVPKLSGSLIGPPHGNDIALVSGLVEGGDGVVRGHEPLERLGKPAPPEADRAAWVSLEVIVPMP
jgi:hypothetical protein